MRPPSWKRELGKPVAVLISTKLFWKVKKIIGPFEEMKPMISPWENRNKQTDFDACQTEILKCYVYGLFDPRDGEPFYIGKAGGKDARGNARVLAHFEEARTSKRVSSKVARIREIWDCGEDIVWKILRSGMDTDAEAFEVEAALIDTLQACGFELCNKQGGYDSRQVGLLSSEDVKALAAPEFDPEVCCSELKGRPIFVFNIYKAVGRMKAEGRLPNYRDATIRAWRVGADTRKLRNAIAIGLVDRISRCAVAIEDWKMCEEYTENARWEIIWSELPKQVSDDILNKSFVDILDRCSGYMQRGGFPIFKLWDEGSGIVYLRGIKGASTSLRLKV